MLLLCTQIFENLLVIAFYLKSFCVGTKTTHRRLAVNAREHLDNLEFRLITPSHTFNTSLLQQGR